MSYSDYTLSRASFRSGISLQGGAVDKKTLRNITIAASVVFVVAVFLLIVWAVKKAPSNGDAPTGGAASARRNTVKKSARLAVELDSEQQVRDALAGTEPAMVFFYMNSCGFCAKADPIFTELAQHPDYAHVMLLKVNSQKVSKLASEYGMRGFPTFLTNWGDRTPIVGYKPKAEMEEILKQAPKRGNVRASVRPRVRGSVAHQRGAVVEQEQIAKDALAGNTPAIVFISASWCGFCKKLQPIWEDVAASGKYNHINLMEIDAQNAPELIKQHGITGFPVMLSNAGKKKYVGFRPREKLEEIMVEVGSNAPTSGGVRVRAQCPRHKQ